jgi:uncharacterized protein
MEKVSRYLVISDAAYADESGVRMRFAYATRTASLMVVDLATAAALQAGDPDGTDPGRRAELRQARVIVPAGDDEMAMVLERNKRAARDRSAVHISLLPTSYCNMSCAYCGQEHSRSRLSAEHRDRVRQRVLRAMRAPQTSAARIDWFGAEPLMGYAVIRDMAPVFVRAAAELGLGYSSVLVTNGSLLTSRNIGVLIGSCGVTELVITVDGPPEIHDAHRPLKSGRGSFWTIVRTVREAAGKPEYAGTEFTFRTNVDVHNIDSVPAYISLMAGLGFALPNVRFSFAPVHSWGNDVTSIEIGIREYAAREAGWLGLLQRHGLKTTLLPGSPNMVVCPAVTTSAEIISSTGNVFSCTEQPLVPEAERTLALTDISQPDAGTRRPLGLFDSWNDDIAGGGFGCSSCVLMPACGGSCPKAWHEGHPPCPSYKFNFQARLDLIAARCGLSVLPSPGLPSPVPPGPASPDKAAAR